MPRNTHPTKSGPGRRHGYGQAHGSAPKPPKGAPWGFEQRNNPSRAARRALVAQAGGIRQFKLGRRGVGVGA